MQVCWYTGGSHPKKNRYRYNRFAMSWNGMRIPGSRQVKENCGCPMLLRWAKEVRKRRDTLNSDAFSSPVKTFYSLQGLFIWLTCSQSPVRNCIAFMYMYLNAQVCIFKLYNAFLCRCSLLPLAPYLNCASLLRRFQLIWTHTETS